MQDHVKLTKATGSDSKGEYPEVGYGQIIPKIGRFKDLNTSHF